MTTVAVVGLGLMGDLHVRTLVDMLGKEQVIGVETNSARANEVRQRLGIRVEDSLEAVLEHVDAVSVTLPDHLHVNACVAALRAGRTVLVEKPLAVDTAQCRQILQARVREGQLMVGHVLRFDLRLRELKRRLDSGDFGSLRYVRIQRANNTTVADKVAERVSVTAFLGVHDLDLLMWLTGQTIQHADAHTRAFSGTHADLCIATLQMSGGATAVVENHWLVHPDSARSCLAGIQVFGDAGMAIVDLSTDELEVVTSSTRGSRRVDSRNWTHDANVSGGSLRRELETFVAMVNGGPVPISGEEGAAAVAAVELIESAARQGSSLEATR